MEVLPNLSLNRRAVLAAPALLLTGLCARAQSAPASAQRRKVVLALGGKTALYYLPVTLADQLGFFRDEGLDVELRDHAGGSLARQSMVDGQADVVAGAYENTIFLRQTGPSATAFVFFSRAPQMVFGVSNRTLHDFRSPTQLRGRRIGITARDSSSHWFTSLVLARARLTSADVNLVGIGNTVAAVTALREGQVDAIANIDPVISLLEYRQDIRVLWDTRSLRGTKDFYGGLTPGGCLYARQDFLLRSREVVQGLTNAMLRALKWLQTAGPGDLVKAVPEAYMYGDRAVYLAAFDKSREALSPDGMVSEESIATAHRVLAGQEFMRQPARPISPGATYTYDFVRRAPARS